MELILWRHADAELGQPDSERRLTDKGHKQAARMAKWLAERLPEDYVVMASPAVRAQQTARALSEDIKTVQFGWPLGMPLVRNMGGGILEVRIRLENRIARLLFALDGSTMVLLHGFIKKTQATPQSDLDLAKDRLKQLRRR